MHRQAKGCFGQSTIKKSRIYYTMRDFFMFGYDFETIRPRNVASAVWGPVAK